MPEVTTFAVQTVRIPVSKGLDHKTSVQTGERDRHFNNTLESFLNSACLFEF